MFALRGHHLMIEEKGIAAAPNPEKAKNFKYKFASKRSMFSTQAKFPIRSSFGALFPKYHNWKLPSFLLSSSSTLWQKLQLRTNSANLSFLSKYTKDLVMGRKHFLFQFGVLNAGFTIRNYSGQLSPHPAQIFGVLDKAAT